jgi:hypothetical protein
LIDRILLTTAIGDLRKGSGFKKSSERIRPPDISRTTNGLNPARIDIWEIPLFNKSKTAVILGLSDGRMIDIDEAISLQVQAVDILGHIVNRIFWR